MSGASFILNSVFAAGAVSTRGEEAQTRRIDGASSTVL